LIFIFVTFAYASLRTEKTRRFEASFPRLLVGNPASSFSRRASWYGGGGMIPDYNESLIEIDLRKIGKPQ
jgi:hypothetical protein